jgi:hypothetical protein
MGQRERILMASLLESIFPGLAQGPYSVTSPISKRYNCIAWATGDPGRWWWPGPNIDEEYWPASVERVETLDAFRDVFVSLGYVVCADESQEPGHEKVALFADADNSPKHAARQLPTGRWTSKLGVLEDIEHDLHALEGAEYGTVVLVLKRGLAA